jgi:aldehyde dehydrogenase (NAD+)
MTFRTPIEAVALANNTNYGLAASVWSENINLALSIAGQIQAGTVWINCTNVFDAASGFGGYRESGYGREGGREGLYEYLKPAWEVAAEDAELQAGKANDSSRSRRRATLATEAAPAPNGAHAGPNGHAHSAHDGSGGFAATAFGAPPIDRTAKLFIGGKQARPDSGYSREIYSPSGEALGEVGEGNRKDIRNAVEAAHKASPGWAAATAHNRAQILYYIAENLAVRTEEFAARIVAMTGCTQEEAEREVEASIERLFSYGAWADKYDGAIHRTPLPGMTLADNEPIGVMALVCPDERPLLGFISLVAPAVAMGNVVIAIPSERHPLSATDFYSVLETSDVPAGVVNIVTGPCDTLAKVLAQHDDVDAIWCFGSAEGARAVEEASAGNMKRTWVSYGHSRDWLDATQGEGREFLRESTQVKNIWIPSGE